VISTAPRRPDRQTWGSRRSNLYLPFPDRMVSSGYRQWPGPRPPMPAVWRASAAGFHAARHEKRRQKAKQDNALRRGRAGPPRFRPCVATVRRHLDAAWWLLETVAAPRQLPSVRARHVLATCLECARYVLDTCPFSDCSRVA